MHALIWSRKSLLLISQKRPKPDLALGMRHTDNGILQDQVSCLQVTRDNGKTWVRVPFVPGALVINLGDIGHEVYPESALPLRIYAAGKLPPKQQDKPSTNADIASDDVSLSKPSPTLPLSEPDTSFKASVTTAGESVISIATSKSQAAFISTPEVIEFISPSAAVSHADHFVNQSAIAKYNLKVWFSYQKLV
ncbi:hypothetical protein F2Q68_00026411 [Brassica cretica]|uniref:Isopenicillin N synthase-like Fe(2+) 2OG dioxygenase domain-containing protein n=1 Tax=Brassica cretica TaxID=69181 RepID=A0A8S9IFY0_BRACR|nr:hypothetical protein F2Q68_00026411 [Brassica cretica]